MADEALVMTKLIGDSTRFPRQVLDGYRLTLRGIAPKLILQRQNVDGSQLRVSDMANFAGKPILVITGEHDIDHPREVDGAIVDWLNENGADAEFNFMVDNGIAGNGHMVMLEENSAEVAAAIADWIDTR
jgi:pimeloyl-ACP methyl ester carboxylesterase